jgi:TonB-linked SusC/RagA family outer membrane protein
MTLQVTGKAIQRLLPSKLLFIMNLCAILLLTTALQVSASAFSQNVTISERKIKLEKVFRLISKQTGYEFIINGKLLDNTVPVSLDVKNATIEEVLTKCLKDQQLSFTIKNRIIVIKKVMEEPVAATAAAEPPPPPPTPIKGKITDAKGVPLLGISITVSGGKGGASTDANGEFTVNVEPGDKLTFSGVGFAPQTITVGAQTSFTIVMSEAPSQLSDMVVVGYGTQRRKDVTGAVTSIKIENSPKSTIPNVNALEAIQGAPGINIGPSTSAGADPSIVVRGQNSISARTAPLIVLDGVIFNGSINEINMNDIASFDILKDASSAAIYGSRSANGVVMITTKRGRSEKPQINFNTYYGKQSWTRKPDMRKGEDYIQWRKDSKSITGQQDLSLPAILAPFELKAYNANHQIDWYDEVTQSAPIQSYQLSISGRSKNTNYYVSGGYLKQNGVLSNDNYKKPNLTVKIENNVTDWLSFGVNGYFSSRNYSGTSPDMYLATYLSPYSYMYLDSTNKTLQRYPTGTAGINNPYWGNPNLAQPGYYDDDLEKYSSLRGTGFVNVKIPQIPGLNYRLNITASKNTAERAYFHHEFSEVNTLVASEIANPLQFLNKANGYKQTTIVNSYVLDNLLTYTHSFGDHNIDVLAGYTRDQTITDLVKLAGSDFSGIGTTALSYNGLPSAATRTGLTNNSTYANVGYIGRINYNYKGRYYVTGNFRRDGSSVFSDGHKFGNFPGASVAWALSEENFMKPIKAINYLKLRASYGKTGNQAIDPYSTQFTVNSTNLFTVFGSTTTPFTVPSQLGNSGLSWEKTTSFNLGANFALLDNRLTGSIDVYKGSTKDQLLTQSIPILTGFSSVKNNLGQVDNKGIEISLNSVNIRTATGFTWETGVSWWMNRNKIVHLTGLDGNHDGKEDDDVANSLFIGKSLGAIYDYTFDGIVQTSDVDYMNTTGFKPGDVKFRDISGPDGKPDGKITTLDRSVIGYAKENYNFNISNTFSYKNFTLYFAINAIIGGGKDHYFMSTNIRSLDPGAVLPTSANWINLSYWMPDRPDNKIPRPNYTNPLGYGFYQGRTFARLQDLGFSYNLSKSLLDKMKISDLKFFVSAKNLFTITGWTGLDPANGAQIGGNGGSTNATVNQSPPLMRSVTFGLNLGF